MVFGILVLLWNLAEFLAYDLLQQYLPVVSSLTFFSLLIVALNFPFYMRTRVSFVVIAGVLAGMLAALVLVYFHEGGKFVYAYLDYYCAVTFVSFIFMIYYKIRIALPQAMSFFRHTLLVYILTFVIVVFLDFPGAKTNVIRIFDILFFITILSLKLHFPPIDHSPSLLSVISHGNKPKLVFEKSIPVRLKEMRELKIRLWNLYTEIGLEKYIDKFWYNILVDETLDNALEHGGKRSSDDITIQVFEGKKYYDFYIIDRGKGFDPAAVPSPLEINRQHIPSGRGIHLLRNCFDIKWNFVGNEVRVRIKRFLDASIYSPSNSQMENT